MSQNNFVRIVIGDDSSDGHAKRDSFIFTSNKPMEDVQKAYDKAKQLHPNIAPDTFCDDYENNTVPEYVVHAVKGLGGPDIFDEYYDQTYRIWHPETMANYTAWFCGLGDTELKLNLLDIPQLDTYGIGYGLYS